jgi:hypothetical protein
MSEGSGPPHLLSKSRLAPAGLSCAPLRGKQLPACAFESRTMSYNSNSTPAAQAARNASNATKTGTKPPVQRMPVPVQGPSSIKLPAMRINPAPVAKGLPSRLQAGPVRMVPNPMNFGDAAGWPAGCCPMTGPGSVGPGFRGK